jgi:hypothetical protein
LIEPHAIGVDDIVVELDSSRLKLGERCVDQEQLPLKTQELTHMGIGPQIEGADFVTTTRDLGGMCDRKAE